MIVDRGADFGSVSFETLFTRYGITKKERPAQQPRFGSVIERLFGTTTTMFLNQLLGNTQATKVPRQMTREVDPKRLAVWTLEHFSTRCAEWMYLSQWHWFAEWSIGCIGILRDWVVDTVAALYEEGATTFTLGALKKYALQTDQRVRLEMEARAGEHTVEAGKARSHQQLEELLRKAPAAPASEMGVVSPTQQSQTLETAIVGKKPSTSRVGERAPRRDPVGQVRTENDTLKCSFRGALAFRQIASWKQECMQ